MGRDKWYSGLIIIYRKDWLKFKTRKIVFSKDTVAVIYSVLRAGGESSLTFSNSTLSRDSHAIFEMLSQRRLGSRCQLLYSNFIQVMESRYEYTYP